MGSLRLGVLVAVQAALAGVFLVAWMLCLAGGSVDRHTCGADCVEAMCRPGAADVAWLVGASALLWGVGLFAGRRGRARAM